MIRYLEHRLVIYSFFVVVTSTTCLARRGMYTGRTYVLGSYIVCS